MKKTLLIILFCLLSLSLIFAEANDQKIYSVDSTVYKNIVKLYLATGHAMPSTTGPWSGDELTKMLEKLDADSIPEYLSATYESVVEELGVEPEKQFDGGAMELSGSISLDIYAHTYNKKDITRKDTNGIEETAFAGRNWWFGKDLNKNTPFFNLEWETWLGNNFYTYFAAFLSNSIRGAKEVGSTNLNSNIPTLQNFELDFKLLDINFPNRAFASIGGSGWSVELGRDQLNWGSGSTGNLVISNNFPYHEMARATVYTSRFKYTYLVSFFPCKMNYYSSHEEETGEVDDEGKSIKKTVIEYRGDNNNGSSWTLNGLYFYTAHRFEGRLLDDKLTLTVTEALTYESQSSSIQFQILNPLNFMHNGYMPSNSNSTLAFELNWTPIKGLGIYGQLLIDQFAMPGFETSPGPNKDEDVTTDGKAFLLGAKYITGVADGILTINPEVVYVQPFAYLRDAGHGPYGLDYIAAVKYRLYSYEDYADHTDILYDEDVIGYTYGPDSLVANLSAQWEKGNLTIGGKFFFMAHGTHDLWTIWKKIPAHTSEEDYNKQYSGITSDHSVTGNYRYGDEAKSRDSIWYTLDIGLSAQYAVSQQLTASVTVDYVKMNNIFNVSTNDASDFQVTMGVVYKPF